ncbi:zinc finger protein 36, C3H1 type-like 1 [Arapaima gigas]
MPSNLLTPFLELDEEFCRNFRSLDVADGTAQRPLGFRRRHSLCPITLLNSKFNGGAAEPCEEVARRQLLLHSWSREPPPQLPGSSLSHIPFRVDRSVSMIEGSCGARPTLAPAGLSASTSSLPSPKCPLSASPVSARYKTELCRTYEESGACKYGAKCQFAHGAEELRGLSRHPKYKTEPCRTFHTIGFCPYGARCHFIHNADEQQQERPRLLRHSVSFAGFSCQGHTPCGLQGALSRASSGGSPGLLSPVLSEMGALFPGELGGFRALSDSHGYGNWALRDPERPQAAALLHRSGSADSLSDQDGYTSSSSLSGSESPSFEGKRLPIFSRLSVADS